MYGEGTQQRLRDAILEAYEEHERTV
jgi:hypothetical protein